MKKIKYVIPYVLMLIITPFYSLLDRLVIVEVFGCGCVPGAQSNMFHIAFNANDFRHVFYSALTVGVTFFSVKITKRVSSKWLRAVYCGSVFAINMLLTMGICKASMWN